MRIWLALRALWGVLVDPTLAQRIRVVLSSAPEASGEKVSDQARPAGLRPAPELSGQDKPRPMVEGAIQPVAVARAPARSEALTLLAALQREARLLDLVQEPLGNYSDAQIGAAARDVLRNSAAVLERLFGLQPATADEEGSDVEVPHGYDPLQYKVVGRVSGEPPFRGKLAHHGWVATRCELPGWTGPAGAAHVIAPIEVEIG